MFFNVHANNIQPDSDKMMECFRLHGSGCWPKHNFHIICVQRFTASFVDAFRDGELQYMQAQCRMLAGQTPPIQ